MSLVQYACQDHVATITLNRTEQLNAFNPELYQEFNAATKRFKDDPDAWVAIICSANEQYFSVGVDIKALAVVMASGKSKEELEAIYTVDLESEFFSDKPIIAAINGYCVGEGLSLALGCDMRIASKNAVFSLPEAKIGVPTVNAAIHGTRLIGSAYMMEMLLTGDKKDAAWAEKTGLVNQVVDNEDLMPTALALAKKIAALSPLAIRATKEAAKKADYLSFEQISQMMQVKKAQIAVSKDFREGQQAFLQKRDPVFTGE
ncbi:enoyl-CoA hydratase/isomerase family protein [Shewanella acanthi]|uniref:enoyl-CoA hydratase/isomerase family protein n=1 Tax=Shewanella acanthi TaxID=2864212 RepID=UPI001C657F42|nr:enoyl-CoA hydratase-related protein [Shewanella acanthi]QYJ80100.1 enoyl-CoA hydratase/isomerase family protein [Shewanella acanthi]